MRVVFLDLDGVMNSAAFFGDKRDPALDALPQSFDQRSAEHWAMMIDPSAVVCLNDIIRQTGAVVVISSSWRYVARPKMIQAALDLRGFTGEVIDRTPKNNELDSDPIRWGDRHGMDGERGREIDAWIVGSRRARRVSIVAGFAILDDAGPSAFGQLDTHLVQTTWARGLESHQSHHVAEAVQMLTEGPSIS